MDYIQFNSTDVYEYSKLCVHYLNLLSRIFLIYEVEMIIALIILDYCED